MEYVWMKKDEEFAELIPIVTKFSLETLTPLWQNVGEVASSFTNPSHRTLLVKACLDPLDKIVGYLHGYNLSSVEFMISQAYNKEGEEIGTAAFRVFEGVLRRDGFTKILCLIPFHPRAYEKYGFKFERYLVTKQIA